MKIQARWTKHSSFALISILGITLAVGSQVLAGQNSSAGSAASSAPQMKQQSSHPNVSSSPNHNQLQYQEQQGMQNQQNQPRYYTQQNGQRRDQQQMGMQSNQQGQRRYYSQSRQGQQRQQQASSGRWQLDPQGWVNLGYDYNNDGIFDAFERITFYDLQKMKASQQQTGSQMQQSNRFSAWQQGDQVARQNQRQDVVEGNIVEARTVKIANSGQQHVIAKVKNQYGTAKIDLGPQQNLSSISMQQGDHIKVSGVEGSINDNFILLADRLQVNGQRVEINRQDAKPLKKFEATVLNTRTVSKGQQNNLMARLELQNGTRTIANFGPKAQLPQISQGQQIQLLARVTEIDGKKALIADRLRTQGETYRIDWNQVRKGASS